MIISKGRAYVFVHIPKTGGTSLALALEARAMRDDLLIGDTPKAQRRRKRVKGLQARGRLWKHSTLADIDGILSPEDLAGVFTFTLVRNPWDRIVSYYHWLRAQGFAHPMVTLAQQLAFPDFLRHGDVRHSFEAFPARRYMTDAQGEERCNLYLRLEHFRQDAQPLFEHLGFEFDLPRSNASSRQTDHRAYFDADTRQIVASICAEDINRFGYAFDD